VCRLFLSRFDVTLSRLRNAARICGLIPRELFEAVQSAETLKDARSSIITAIRHDPNIGASIENAAGDLPTPHRAFMIYPGDERRKLLGCLIKPVSA
jgi:hypothetical protein